MKTESKKLNILYVFGGEKAQGAEIVIERLMEYNAPAINAHLILAPGKFADDLKQAGKPYQISVSQDLKKLNRTSGGKLRYYAKGISNYLTISYKVFRYIKKHRIDVVHANTMVAASYLIPALKFARMFLPRVKWLWSDHDLKYFSALDIRLSKLCAKNYDRTLVVSNVIKRKYGASEKAVVLYNGLNPDTFKPDQAMRAVFRQKYGLNDTDLIIGLAAKITPGKGQVALANAFNVIAGGYTSVKLIFAGDYPPETPGYNNQLKGIIDASQNIYYLGYINQVAAFFNGCDIIVSNSDKDRSEPLGTTIYEAMACEKIVVASNTGGTPEIITDKVNGYVFGAEDEAALQEALSFVISNYSSLKDVRLAARKKVLAQFTVNVMAANYQLILQSL